MRRGELWHCRRARGTTRSYRDTPAPSRCFRRSAPRPSSPVLRRRPRSGRRRSAGTPGVNQFTRSGRASKHSRPASRLRPQLRLESTGRASSDTRPASRSIRSRAATRHPLMGPRDRPGVAHPGPRDPPDRRDLPEARPGPVHQGLRDRLRADLARASLDLPGRDLLDPEVDRSVLLGIITTRTTDFAIRS